MREATPSTTALPAEKAQLRGAIRAARAARGADERAAVGARLAACVDAIDGDTVAAFVACGGEPATLPLLDALRARGTRVLLPILCDDMDLEWAEYVGADALVPAGRGLLEPTTRSLGREALREADVVLVPALAVDDRGARLGQGGGSYDRALPRALGLVIAIVHDDEVVDAVPSEPHDLGVDGVLTPGGGLRLVARD